MGIRISSYLLAFIVGLSLFCPACVWGAADPDVEPVELFKRFASGQVPFAEATCRLEVHDVKGNPALDLTNYIYLRFQSNALLFAELISPFNETNLHLQSEGSIVSRFEESYWYRYHTDTYSWKKEGDEQDVNVVERNYLAALHGGITRVLNGGCDFLPAFSIKWSGDGFVETNRETGFVVSGMLSRDSAGRAKSLSVKSKKPGSASEYSCQFDYEYSESLSVPYLPRTIRKGPVLGVQKDDLVLVWELTFLNVTVSDTTLNEAGFSLAGFTNNLKNSFVVSNQTLYYKRDGVVRSTPDTQSKSQMERNFKEASKAKSRIPYIRIAWVIVAIVPLIYFWKRLKSAA